MGYALASFDSDLAWKPPPDPEEPEPVEIQYDYPPPDFESLEVDTI